MLLLIFTCFFAFLLKFEFIAYNESLLLALFFVIFFYLIYLIFELKFKEYIFFTTYKIYSLILMILKLSYFFQKLLSSIYIIKKRVLRKYFFKSFFIKRSVMIKFNKLFEHSLVIYCIYLILNITKILQYVINNCNIIAIFLFDKICNNDNFLFYK